MELEDDIAMALATGSLPELVTTLSRRHTCACSHPVHEAVRRRHVGALRMLLAHGFKADELCGGYGERLTPLQVCLGAGADGDVFCTMTVEQQVQMVEALLDHGANPNVHIPRPWGLQGTALHVACHQVNVWLVQVLLARGANPNACDSVGQTALHTAATFANGHPNGREITELLVASGASPLATCHRDLTARQYSLDHSVQRTLARAERWWRCRMLAWVRSRSVTENVVRWLPEDALRLVADML
jgi:ankyrin repeat protein